MHAYDVTAILSSISNDMMHDFNFDLGLPKESNDSLENLQSQYLDLLNFTKPFPSTRTCPGEKRPRKSATAPSSIDAPWALWAVNAQPANVLHGHGDTGSAWIGRIGWQWLKMIKVWEVWLRKKNMQDFALRWILG